MQEEHITEEETAELVQMIMQLGAQDRYQEVLGIWKTYIGMVFDEQRTKVGQAFEIRNSLREHERDVRERALTVPASKRSFNDAAEIMAINFIVPVVAQAFDFSTYSGAKRCAYIQRALQVEIDDVNAKIDPVRHILDEFLKDGDSNG